MINYLHNFYVNIPNSNTHWGQTEDTTPEETFLFKEWKLSESSAPGVESVLTNSPRCWIIFSPQIWTPAQKGHPSSPSQALRQRGNHMEFFSCCTCWQSRGNESLSIVPTPPHGLTNTHSWWMNCSDQMSRPAENISGLLFPGVLKWNSDETAYVFSTLKYYN